MGNNFKKYFFTGIIVLFPLAASALVVYWLFNLLDSWASPLTHHLFGYRIPGLGLMITLLIIVLTGAFSSNVIGRWFLGIMDHLFMDVPVFRTIYQTTKQVMQVFSPNSKGAFRSVVLVENPRTGNLAIGFVSHEIILETSGKKELHLAIYVPTNQLYLGDLLFYKPEHVRLTNLSVQQGIQSLISAGAMLPSKLKTGTYPDGK